MCGTRRQRQAFFPYLQQREPGTLTAYVRTNHGAESAFAQIRELLRQLDPNLPISGTRTLETQVANSLRNDRLVALLSSIFGGLATLLAVIGLYGVMAYTVSRRTREIGIRMALGARMGNIGWLVIREVVTIVAIGMALGLPAAWWLGRYVSAQLYGVKTTDPLTVIAATALLCTVALLAGLIPSVRAARVSPTTALRYE